MKKMLIISLFSIVALYGCDRPDGDKPYTVDEPHYILGYQTSRNIEVKQSDGNTTRDCFWVDIGGSYGVSIVMFCSEGEDLETYLMLCDKNGDNGYKQKRALIPGEDQRYTSLGYEISGMDLVSDAAFDSEHPAGASLADICRLHIRSFRRYIESGYKKTFNWKNPPEGWRLHALDGWNTINPVIVSMQDLRAEDMRMVHVYVGCDLCMGDFLYAPTAEKEHNMTLTIEFADGETREIPFTMKWQ